MVLHGFSGIVVSRSGAGFREKAGGQAYLSITI